MNNKEKYADVYRTAQELRISTNLLRQKSKKIYFLSYLTAILPAAIYAFLLVFFSQTDCDCSSEAKQTISLMVFFVSFIVMFLLQMRLFFRTGTLFKEVMEKCGVLSDMVDWTSMRKRQVYSDVDPKIQDSINDFFEYSLSTQCPYYGGRAKYKSLRYLSIVEMITVMVFSLLFTFGVISI